MAGTFLTIVRYVAVVGLFICLFLVSGAGGEQSGDELGARPPNVFLFVGCVVALVVLLLKELGAFVLEPIGRFLASLIYPDEAGIPPADYTLSKVYREQGRYEEALERYQTILKHHPGEFRAYLEGVETAFWASEPKVALKLLKMSRSRLDDPEQKAEVEAVYQRCLAEPPPGAEEEAVEEVAEEASAVSEEESPR